MLTHQKPLTKNLFASIKAKALALGFDHCAATTPVISEEDKQAFLKWCAAGHAGGMAYMVRDPKKRVQLTESYPTVKSVLTLGVSYYQGPWPEKPGKAYGRVARYAWGLDYHAVIVERLNILVKEIEELVGETGGVTVAVDTKPILERALAKQAGLGFIGKNTVLIGPRSLQHGLQFHLGSFLFLTEVLLDFPLEGDVQAKPLKNGCGDCTSCLTACPTDAFEGPYQLKADKCISYLTIENKGWIPLDMRSKIGDWLFGCDVCQDVCPYNAKVAETRWPEFKAEQGVGPWVSLKDILKSTNQTHFKMKWGHTPFARSKRKGLLRNACVVAGNSEDKSLVPDLKEAAADSEPLVRGHALWALSQLQPRKQNKSFTESHLKYETDVFVRNECNQILQA